MNIAFCLFKYFPYGGLQRDFIRIARACLLRGHTVHVYTMSWDGDIEPGLHIHILPAEGRQNHVRNHSFAENVKTELVKHHYDVVVGFNKMPYLDWLCGRCVFSITCTSAMDYFIGYRVISW